MKKRTIKPRLVSGTFATSLRGVESLMREARGLGLSVRKEEDRLDKYLNDLFMNLAMRIDK